MPGRNDRPETASEIARVLRYRYARLHGKELRESDVAYAIAGDANRRRMIEEAGGANLLPPVRRRWDFRPLIGGTRP